MKYSELLKQVEMPTFMEAVRLLWQDRSAVWKDTKNALTDLFLAFIWIGMIVFVWVLWPGVFVWRLVKVATRRFVTWAKTMYTLWRLVKVATRRFVTWAKTMYTLWRLGD